MATSRNRKKEARILTRGVLLLQVIAPAHNSQVARTAAIECGFEILPLVPYSPEMAPSDFYLFSEMKSHLRGTQYGTNTGDIESVNEYLGDEENAFYFAEIRNLEQRWAKCINWKGVMFKFSFPGSPKNKGKRIFLSSLV